MIRSPLQSSRQVDSEQALRLPCAASSSASALVSLTLVLSLALLPASLVRASQSASETDNNVSSTSAALDPQALIAAMSDAMKTLNYAGEFVHMVGNAFEAMRIVHASSAKGEFERLTSLNGEAREVFRNDEEVTCVWPGSKSVIVGATKTRSSIPQIDAGVLQSEYYTAEVLGQDRVANRETHVLSIQPVDEFRYGYRFWIDSQTNMLLRMMLIDSRQRTLEQLMFTSIEYPESIDPSIFKATVNDDAYKFVNTSSSGEQQLLGGNSHGKVTSGSAQTSKPAVTFKTMPGGYNKVSETYDPMPIGKAPMRHLTISDGMASVSVYLEYISASEQEGVVTGLSSMGAVNAYTHSLPEALVTVVGEVPPAVVETLGSSLSLNN